ncbi:hypothetical protein Mgra_00009588, partial [Meloidogyne graminicola]
SVNSDLTNDIDILQGLATNCCQVFCSCLNINISLCLPLFLNINLQALKSQCSAAGYPCAGILG